MQVSNKRVEAFRQMAELFLRNSHLDNTRLFFAVKKVFKKTESLSAAYSVAQQDAREELAAVDKDTKILLVVGDKYQFTAENKKKLNAKLVFLSNTTVEIDPHIIAVSDIPRKLSFTFKNRFMQDESMSAYDVINAFEGFVLPEADEEFVETPVVKILQEEEIEK